MREIVFDTETTGLSPHEGHRLVEIGAIELVNKVETGRSFHVYVNPERAMPSEALAVHGLSDVFLAAKRCFAEECESFLEFIEDSPLIAHNANFDFGFVNFELERCGRPWICETRKICTLAIARTRHPGAKHSLDALCMRYGVDRSQRVLHGALLDAQLLAQVYVELTGGRQIGLTLGADADSRSGQTAMQAAQPDRPIRLPRPHAASQDELARHAAFVARLTDPLWPMDAGGR